MEKSKCKLDQVIQTKYLEIAYTTKDQAAIGDLVNLIESEYMKVLSLFQQEAGDRVRLEVYYSHQDLLEALGFPGGPGWIRGGIQENRILIGSPMNPPIKATYWAMIRTGLHELIHLVLAKVKPNLPRWLDEGVACFLAKDLRLGWIEETFREASKRNDLASFDDLDTKEDFALFFERHGYQHAYSIVDFLMTVYGSDKLLALVRDPHNYQGIFNKSQDLIEEEWKTYVRQSYQGED